MSGNQSGAKQDNRLLFGAGTIDAIVFQIQDGALKNLANQEPN